MFPDSKARFCTSYMKREVYTKYARTFSSGNILMVSGERHEESPKRSKLKAFERHAATAETKKGRLVHWFRPILHLRKSEAFEINHEHGVELHKAYKIGMSRVFCRWCIFNSPQEMEIAAREYPEAWKALKRLENSLGGHTMKYVNGERVSLCDFIHEDAEYEQMFLR